MFDFAAFGFDGDIDSEEAIASFMTQFQAARYGGTMGYESGEKTNLSWTPIRIGTFNEDRRRITAFMSWFAENKGMYPPFKSVAVRTPLRKINGALELSLKTRPERLLEHIPARSPRTRRQIPSPGIRDLKQSTVRNSFSKGAALPTEELIAIIECTNSVVMRAIFILLAFGGPRLSEAIQLWTPDVLPALYAPRLFPTARATAGPVVVLAHPMESTYTGVIGDTRSTRLQYLTTRGLTPRPMLPSSHPNYAGWKGMAFDNPSQFTSLVYWSDILLATQFGDLVQQIIQLRSRLPLAQRHPYLFVNIDQRQPEAGLPVTIHNARKHYYRACRRAGIEPHKFGATIHRSRSGYDLQLKSSGIDAQTRSRMLHQRSLASEQEYGHDPGLLQDELARHLPGSREKGRT